MNKRTKNPKQQKAGQRGGKATLAKYGREYFRELGRRGGRPKLKTLDEIKAAPAPKVQIKIREGMDAHPNNLRVLKELWKLQNNKRGGEVI